MVFLFQFKARSFSMPKQKRRADALRFYYQYLFTHNAVTFLHVTIYPLFSLNNQK